MTCLLDSALTKPLTSKFRTESLLISGEFLSSLTAWWISWVLQMNRKCCVCLGLIAGLFGQHIMDLSWRSLRMARFMTPGDFIGFPSITNSLPTKNMPHTRWHTQRRLKTSGIGINGRPIDVGIRLKSLNKLIK